MGRLRVKRKKPKGLVINWEAVAIHEAGHAVVTEVLGIRVKEVSIKPEGFTLGYSRNEGLEVAPGNREDVERQVMISMAGGEAQWKVAPETMHLYGDEDDKKEMNSIITQFLRLQGGPKEEMQEKGQTYAESLQQRTIDLLNTPWVWDAVRAVAAILLGQGEVSGEKVRSVITRALDQEEVHCAPQP